MKNLRKVTRQGVSYREERPNTSPNDTKIHAKKNEPSTLKRGPHHPNIACNTCPKPRQQKDKKKEKRPPHPRAFPRAHPLLTTVTGPSSPPSVQLLLLSACSCTGVQDKIQAPAPSWGERVLPPSVASASAPVLVGLSVAVRLQRAHRPVPHVSHPQRRQPDVLASLSPLLMLFFFKLDVACDSRCRLVVAHPLVSTASLSLRRCI